MVQRKKKKKRKRVRKPSARRRDEEANTRQKNNTKLGLPSSCAALASRWATSRNIISSASCQGREEECIKWRGGKGPSSPTVGRRGGGNGGSLYLGAKMRKAAKGKGLDGVRRFTEDEKERVNYEIKRTKTTVI